MEWQKLIITLLVPIMTAFWAMWKWTRERQADRMKERNKLAALYINPFLLACEDLQSRLYNILKKRGLSVLNDRYPNKEYAEETLYLIVQYFGWERCIYRYGPYTQDARVIELTEKIRATFAKERRGGSGAFCFFRPEQTALGRVIMQRREGEFGPEFETISLYDFRKLLISPSLSEIGSLKETLTALREAKNVQQLEGRDRLAKVQKYLVDLLSHIEKQEGFSLFVGERKTA